jgi:hypothetical protein
LDFAQPGPGKGVFHDPELYRAFGGGKLPREAVHLPTDHVFGVGMPFSPEVVEVGDDQGGYPLCAGGAELANPHQADLFDKWAFQVVSFYLLRIDVFSRGEDDNLLEPACDEEIPVGVEISEVSRKKPAFLETLGGSFLITDSNRGLVIGVKVTPGDVSVRP